MDKGNSAIPAYRRQVYSEWPTFLRMTTDLNFSNLTLGLHNPIPSVSPQFDGHHPLIAIRITKLESDLPVKLNGYEI